MKYILPKGFQASGVHCGIKRFKKDLALIYSKTGCEAAGLFTKNKVKAAPVIVSKEILNKGKPIRAVIINSGNANCCTGWYGVRDAKRMIEAVSKNLNLRFNNVLASSTGVIGRRLEIGLIEESIPKLVKLLSEKRLLSAAKAVLTTDRRIKVACERFNIGRKEVIMTGIAKGAGMINPNMATMLSFIMTDARIEKETLKSALKASADKSFNAITIDGDMSTNDTVIILANGVAGNFTIRKGKKECKVFLKALKNLTFKLARLIIEDGEGATKFVTVSVENAKTLSDADRVARAIANSCLVKTSIHGENPNWGRIAASIGASGVEKIKPNKIEIWLDGISCFKNGRFTHHSKERLYKIYKRKKVEIVVNLNMGKKDAVVWTCDLSKRYVEINSHYVT